MSRTDKVLRLIPYIMRDPYYMWADITLGQVAEAAEQETNLLGAEYEQAMSERDAKHPWPDPLDR